MSGEEVSATTELLNWDGKRGLHSYGGFVITPYAAIKTPTRRKCEPLTPENQERLDSWGKRARRGVVLKLTRRRIPLRDGFVLEPKAFGCEFGLDPRVVAWLKEQAPVTMRLIANHPRSALFFTIVVYRGREIVGYLAPLRWPAKPQKASKALRKMEED